jgi:hypothetical protein
MLQCGIKLGFIVQKIKMFYRDPKNAWVVVVRDLLSQSVPQTNYCYCFEHRNEEPPVLFNFNSSVTGYELNVDIHLMQPQSTVTKLRKYKRFFWRNKRRGLLLDFRVLEMRACINAL